MEAELAAAGIDARVQSVPVEADAVGHWIAFGTLGAVDPNTTMALVRELGQQVREHPDFLVLHRDPSGKLWLVVGRPASPGEALCAANGAVVLDPNGGPCPAPPRAG
jgi:hypothetical protein